MGTPAEELVLTKRLGEGVILLHDRRMPGARSNIDHLVVAPSGVWVVGADKLILEGRNRSGLADDLARQVAVVEAAVLESGIPAAVQGVLCVADTELQGVPTSSVRGFPLIGPRGLARRIRKNRPVPAMRVERLARDLDRAFPQA